jgi:hypothetical protein
LRGWTTRRWSVAVGPASTVLLACCAIASESADLLCLLPALALACALLARRYPGERLLVALRHRRPSRWPRARSFASARTRALTVAAHGGLLMAHSLAVRPPPALLHATG